jgi:uncharacterized protein HemX
MASDPRIEEILSALEIIKSKLPNGELEVIKKSILILREDQKAIKQDLEYLKKRLFNPDDGVIVKINKNTDSISRFQDSIDEVPEVKNKVDNIDKWKEGVSKALWIVYTSIVGIILSLIFAAINK